MYVDENAEILVLSVIRCLSKTDIQRCFGAMHEPILSLMKLIMDDIITINIIANVFTFVTQFEILLRLGIDISSIYFVLH